MQEALSPETLLLMLQLCDGNFPNGGFSHSFGLETLIEKGNLASKTEFCTWLDDWIARQLFPSDGLFVHLAWQAAFHKEWRMLEQLDQISAAACLAEDTRNGQIRMGRQTASVLADLLGGEMIRHYHTAIRTGNCYGFSSVAMGIGFAEMGVPCRLAISAVLFASVNTMVAAGIRAIPLGQTDGQYVLKHCRQTLTNLPDYEGLTVNDIASFAFDWEIAQMQHKQIDGRLFMS